ncbi:hypothetical protein AKN87_04335 [Thiopseudomonas alkaliphila]|nr:hypothetical protein AKN87_04335 [Thiopseudomonas alkaliphila]AKX46598.1 hypothetical protein AKN94_03940 [Thiopseudomonas alkaliphila]AKX49703.1 hypothetical protein AKN93_10110 [Thiopseudomonas alkaliphila]AKX52409.1 hypothetical protein AKN91_01000 [Thiopseudomonas alkaliphila]
MEGATDHLRTTFAKMGITLLLFSQNCCNKMRLALIFIAPANELFQCLGLDSSRSTLDLLQIA